MSAGVQYVVWESMELLLVSHDPGQVSGDVMCGTLSGMHRL